MGYACYEHNGRDQGYGVPAKFDHPDCNKDIDRGVAYACGGDPMDGCGLFFCPDHLAHYENDGVWGAPICERCADEDAQSFDAKPDTANWISHKMNDQFWTKWRAENPEFCAANIGAIKKRNRKND